MIAAALTAAIAAAVDCILAAVAHQAAAKYRLRLSFFRGATPVLLSASIVLQAALGMHYGNARGLWVMAAAGAAGICAITDAQTGYVFDALTLPTLALILAAACFSSAFTSAALGAAAAGGALFCLYTLTRGRGIGLGDVKLACCIGGALGVTSGMRSLQFAFVLGGVYAAALILLRVLKRGDALPFAPFLYAGMVLAALESA